MSILEQGGISIVAGGGEKEGGRREGGGRREPYCPHHLLLPRPAVQCSAVECTAVQCTALQYSAALGVCNMGALAWPIGIGSSIIAFISHPSVQCTAVGGKCSAVQCTQCDFFKDHYTYKYHSV